MWTRYWPPVRSPVTLGMALRPAGREHLDVVSATIADLLPPPDHGAALELVVGLPRVESPTHGGDIDDYLLPVVERLGGQRFTAVFGHKTLDAVSTIAVDEAVVRPAGEAPNMTARTTVPTDRSTEWKTQVVSACPTHDQSLLPDDGPVWLEVAYTVSSRRDWVALWKATIDSLGPVLGVPDPAQPLAARDDRIVTLGLYRTIDEHLGDDVVIDLWWGDPTVTMPPSHI